MDGEVVMYTFLVYITFADLLKAQEDENLMSSIISKMGYDMKRMFVRAWKAFSRSLNLTSADTCLFGGYLCSTILARYHMKNYDVNNTLRHGASCPYHCFISEKGDIDLFFKSWDTRDDFLRYLRGVFHVKIAEAPSYNGEHANTSFSVNVIRLKLSPNLPRVGVPVVFLYVDLVYKTDSIVSFCKVKSLQLGPEKGATIEPFQQDVNPFLQCITPQPVDRVMHMSDIVVSIVRQTTEINILPHKMFLKIYPHKTDNPDAYQKYWQKILKRGQRMMADGWTVKNLHTDQMLYLCVCHDPLHVYELNATIENEKDHLDIHRVCLTCSCAQKIWSQKNTQTLLIDISSLDTGRINK
jgi:hypothetical protein